MFAIHAPRSPWPWSKYMIVNIGFMNYSCGGNIIRDRFQGSMASFKVLLCVWPSQCLLCHLICVINMATEHGRASYSVLVGAFTHPKNVYFMQWPKNAQWFDYYHRYSRGKRVNNFSFLRWKEREIIHATVILQWFLCIALFSRVYIIYRGQKLLVLFLKG